jgi:methionyl-tRNA formyltransferase
MKNQELKTVFLGTSDFAIPALESLILGHYNVVAVITQPDKPAGRKGISTPPPIKVFAEQKGLKVLQPASFKNEEFFELFKNLAPDICVLASYGRIIPDKYLSVPKFGFVNIHPSLLPKYRGSSPIQSAIMNGEKETGVSIMLMDSEVDHGPILAKREFSIFNFQFSNYKEIEKVLAELGAKLLIEILPDYVSGKVSHKGQKHSEATYTKILKREDGKINWNEPAEKIYNLIRALNPEPGTWCLWRGKILNIRKAELLQNVAKQPGTVSVIDSSIVIGAKDGSIAINVLQLEGSKETDAKSFLNGHQDFINSVLE